MSNLFDKMSTENLKKLHDRLGKAIALSLTCTIDLRERYEAVTAALASRS